MAENAADDQLIEWMSETLSELAGIDTHETSLRDNPAAYEVLGVLLARVVDLTVKALEAKAATPAPGRRGRRF